MNVLPFAVALVVTAAVSALATPLFATFASRRDLVVQPREDRWHTKPTPLLGGAAIALAVLLLLAASLPERSGSLALLAGAAGAFALGLLDDFRHLAPTTKLVGQAMIGSLLAYGGVQVGIVSFPPVAFILTVFWVVAMMNAMNLIDNMDGLAAGIAVIAAIVLGLTGNPSDPRVAVIAGATAGASLGFLVHNFYPARVFMGDAGSLLLGFLLASAALLHTASAVTNVGLALVGPLVVLALPIFDTAFVTAMRRISGRSLSRGGRDHVSHRLVALGLSDRLAVVLLYAVAGGLALVGALLNDFWTVALPTLALASVGLVLFGVFLSEVDVYGGSNGLSTTERPQAHVLRALATYGRFGIEIGLDFVLLTVAYYFSYVVRFEGLLDIAWLDLFVKSVPLVVGIQLGALVLLMVYRTLWRYLSVADAVVILRATTVGTGAAALALLLVFRFENFSRAVFVFDWLLASALIISSRAFALWLRHWFTSRPRSGTRRVLIVGATDGGSVALRLLTRVGAGPYHAVGFLDDDPGKRYRRLGGVPIVGTTDELEKVVPRLRIDVVVLALEQDAGALARVRDACQRLGVEYREFLAPV